MGIISWILLGLVAGYIAKRIHKGPTPTGFFPTLFIGVVGALVGGWIGSFTFIGEVSGFNLWSIMIATFGAVLSLWVHERYF
jgi:uncharacterized membrane protein YeaQ/YmgE (transglycosylase-associated protein family)